MVVASEDKQARMRVDATLLEARREALRNAQRDRENDPQPPFVRSAYTTSSASLQGAHKITDGGRDAAPVQSERSVWRRRRRRRRRGKKRLVIETENVLQALRHHRKFCRGIIPWRSHDDDDAANGHKQDTQKEQAQPRHEVCIAAWSRVRRVRFVVFLLLVRIVFRLFRPEACEPLLLGSLRWTCTRGRGLGAWIMDIPTCRAFHAKVVRGLRAERARRGTRSGHPRRRTFSQEKVLILTVVHRA